MSKKVIFSPQEQLLEGIEILERAVASTLGPKGRTVIIENAYPTNIVTKDGVTVAKKIDLDDPIQNLGASLIKQAASKTADVAGDGTTTATILASRLAREAYEETKSIPAIDIKRQIDADVEVLMEELAKISKPVTMEDILPIATISANNDPEIGAIIMEAYNHVTLDGLIALEDSKTGKTHVTLNEGFVFNNGYVSPYFITDPRKKEAVLENPLIFVTDKKVNSAKDIEIPLKEAHARNRPLLIIADEVELNALNTMLVNQLNGIIKACAVRAPSFGNNRAELLADIAALTSATIFSERAAMSLSDLSPAFLGSAKKVIVSEGKTTIIDGNASPAEVANRIAQIEEQLKAERVDDYIVTQLASRLAGLKAKVAVLHVGAPTENELREKKDRVDDALRATRSAIAKGYVLGGGRTLYDLSKIVKSNALREALLAPITKLAQSINFNVEELKNAMDSDPKLGLNAKSCAIEDLDAAKIYDPALVLEQVIVNGVSAASMVILSDTVVYNTDRTPAYSPGSLDDLSA